MIEWKFSDSAMQGCDREVIALKTAALSIACWTCSILAMLADSKDWCISDNVLTLASVVLLVITLWRIWRYQ